MGFDTPTTTVMKGKKMDAMNTAITKLCEWRDSELQGNEKMLTLWRILGEFQDEVVKEEQRKTAERIKDEIDHFIEVYCR